MFSNIKKFIVDSFLNDVHNVPLWFIAFYIFGILVYFYLSFEPSVVVVVIATGAMIIAAYLLLNLRIYFILLFFFLLGITVSSYKTYTIKTPGVVSPLHNVETFGVIDQIYTLYKGRKLVLKNVQLIGVEKFANDVKIQVTIRSKNDLAIGDRIKLLADLYPVQENFLPSSYDFALYSFFNKIAMTGYATSKITVIGKDVLSIQNYIDQLRNYIFLQIKQNMSEDTSGIAVALMIGDQKAINSEILDNMRKSGLSHILSVSGMHLSLLSIICFFVIRYFLSNFSGLCQRYNTKKIAAYFALIATLFYLLISGSQVSAVRSFIMVALVTFSVIMDREADSKRSVCAAAFVILLFSPESVFSPSFQMSFVSVLALVSSYELYMFFNSPKQERRTWFSKFRFYVLATAFSSFIAGTATAIFVVYNFNNYSNYSVIANVLVAPIVSVIIMPMVVLSFVLLPLKLHFLSLFLLEYGIKAMVSISNFISSLPASSLILAAPESYVVLAFVIGFLWLCFWQDRWRIFGAVLILASFIITVFSDYNPDIVIDRKNNVILVKSGDSLFKIGKKRLSSNYKKQLQIISNTEKTVSDPNKTIHYNFNTDNKNILISLYSQPIFDVYGQLKSLGIKNNNGVEYNIDISDLNKRGSCFIYLNEDTYKSKCVLDNKKSRPWNS